MNAWVWNAIGFQVCWLAFVAGAGLGYWWTGFVALVPFAAWQLARSHARRADLILMAIAAILGFLTDSALAASGIVIFATPVPHASLAPIWIVGLWLAFALTLNHSLRFLQRRLPIATLLGAVAGPLAYWIAERAWSALTMPAPRWHALVALAVAWALLTPLLAQIAAALTRDTAEPLAAPARP